MLVAGLVLASVYFSHASAFTSDLISGKNTSDALKVLKNNQNLNSKLTAITEITGNGENILPKIISLAAAAPEDYSESLTARKQSSIVTAADNSTIIKPNFAVAPGMDAAIGIYKVAAGDTPETIASRFGLRVPTLLLANSLNESSIIKPGQELKIPAVDGITYTIKSGDTLGALAAKYKVTEDDILDANDLETVEDLMQIGMDIVIPQDNLKLPTAPRRTSIVVNNNNRIKLSTASPDDGAAVGSGSLLWPTSSRIITQKFSRRHNGLDISGLQQNPGPDIYASDDGFVEIAGWQAGGWGNTVVINHGNGLKTRYAHMATIDVEAGQNVSRGKVLGRIGNTGRSTGPHLHYTVYKNGVAVNPQSYVE